MLSIARETSVGKILDIDRCFDASEREALIAEALPRGFISGVGGALISAPESFPGFERAAKLARVIFDEEICWRSASRTTDAWALLGMKFYRGLPDTGTATTEADNTLRVTDIIDCWVPLDGNLAVGRSVDTRDTTVESGQALIVDTHVRSFAMALAPGVVAMSLTYFQKYSPELAHLRAYSRPGELVDRHRLPLY